jgi:alkanesulfonate monooxygenase SsuD/methylene tetrahydromethanopterin reductase-like flavin-dependent oxidoreductase (luciferase family)
MGKTSAPPKEKDMVLFGANCWNQYTDWPSLLEAGRRADRLGYDSLWTWDHVYPIVGSVNGPIFEGWLTLAAWSQSTDRVRLGLMVGANTFRQPTLVAKMATTLDHLSNGRAILGMGAAWFEPEHVAYGFEYGRSPGERLRWLGEALPLIRGMFDGTRPSTSGRYQVSDIRNDPLPQQTHLPILVGGQGERVTLRLVARFADACNFGGSVDTVRHLDEVLRDHCQEVGRNQSEIERTTCLMAVIRDSAVEANRALMRIFERNGGARPWQGIFTGSPDDVAQALEPYAEAGVQHFVFEFPAPYDEETMARLISDVKPRLDKVRLSDGKK